MSQKGSGLLMGIFTSGLGAYAAKNSGSMKTLLTTIAKYMLVIVGIILVLKFITGSLRIEYFMVPVAPSKEGDKKEVTPAGNTILY